MIGYALDLWERARRYGGESGNPGEHIGNSLLLTDGLSYLLLADGASSLLTVA